MSGSCEKKTTLQREHAAVNIYFLANWFIHALIRFIAGESAAAAVHYL
jgi:hypothetical protein